LKKLSSKVNICTFIVFFLRDDVRELPCFIIANEISLR